MSLNLAIRRGRSSGHPFHSHARHARQGTRHFQNRNRATFHDYNHHETVAKSRLANLQKFDQHQSPTRTQKRWMKVPADSHSGCTSGAVKSSRRKGRASTHANTNKQLRENHKQIESFYKPISKNLTTLVMPLGLNNMEFAHNQIKEGLSFIVKIARDPFGTASSVINNIGVCLATIAKTAFSGGNDSDTHSWETHLFGKMTPAEMEAIRPYLPNKFPWVIETIQLLQEGTIATVSKLSVCLGKGQDKQVYAGLFEKEGKICPIALLSYGLKSKDTRQTNAQYKQQTIDNIERTKKLLEPVKGHPNLDLSYLTDAHVVGNEMIIAKPLSLCDLEHGLTGDMTALTYLHMMRDVACGLDALHKEGLVHEDIKPGNILLQKDDSPVGLKAVVTDWDQLDKTGSVFKDTTNCTPFYLPTQLPKNEAGQTILLPSSDVYALKMIISRAFIWEEDKWSNSNEQKEFIQKDVMGLVEKMDKNPNLTAEQVMRELDTLIQKAEPLNFPKLGRKNLGDNFKPWNANW